MSGDLESFVNRPVSVITADGRIFIGKLRFLTIVYFYLDSLQIQIFYQVVTDIYLFQQLVFLSYL